MSIITADMLTENPKPGFSIIICGISKNEEGLYYCPYCDFTSDDIEQFATSMCWDCAFPDELEEQCLPTIGNEMIT